MHWGLIATVISALAAVAIFALLIALRNRDGKFYSYDRVQPARQPRNDSKYLPNRELEVKSDSVKTSRIAQEKMFDGIHLDDEDWLLPDPDYITPDYSLHHLDDMGISTHHLAPAACAAPPTVSPKGRMAYDPPDRMTVQEGVVITVRITREALTSEMISRFHSGLSPTGRLLEQEVPISEVMAVGLHGGTRDFLINPQSHPQQILDGERPFGEWRWEVVPLRRGQHELILVAHCFHTTSDGRLVAAAGLDPVRTKIMVSVNKKLSLATCGRYVVASIFGGIITLYLPSLIKQAEGQIAPIFSTPEAGASPEIPKATKVAN